VLPMVLQEDVNYRHWLAQLPHSCCQNAHLALGNYLSCGWWLFAVFK